MNAYEPIGYFASFLVLVTFCTRGMAALRAVAIASNLAFLGYAALAGIFPVLLLHALLLPINVYRLLQICRGHSHHPARGRSTTSIPARAAVTTGPAADLNWLPLSAPSEIPSRRPTRCPRKGQG